MRKLSDLKAQIPYGIRLKCTVKANNVEELARILKKDKYNNFGVFAEAFNETNMYKDPDNIGVTVTYPKNGEVTHLAIGIFPFEISPNHLRIEIEKLFKNLEKKIPKKSGST